ncbi:hypothetical protein FUAX_42310 (plasmid) [Fulvitalea axinellae]|uniref:Uncharacterized protein n=1 Tax=Fulvitalea axinellae TaxID=1182444 RepID=A0AAU9CZ62_9BACT|nr:hypothetical protein FUAX_42310 [Fulvitalea axinellae]
MVYQRKKGFGGSVKGCYKGKCVETEGTLSLRFDEGVEPQDFLFDIVNPDGLNIIDTLTLFSLRAHRMYWDKDPNAKNCLSIIAKATMPA